MRRPVLVLMLATTVGAAAWTMAQNRAAGPREQSSQAAPADDRAGSQQRPEEDEPALAVLSGKVVLLSEAFKRRGIASYAEEINGQVALATGDGDLVPIVPDWRGRAFFQDERLRDRRVDLVVNRHPGVPWVQVLSIYTFDEQGVRNITDYWCDICAIPMYEIKDCECCQGPVRLRFRPQELPQDLKLLKTSGSK